MDASSLESIASEIARHARRPTLIAIEGFGGSGKSTVARRLAALLGEAYVVHFDDFIVKERLTERSWDKGAFDRGRLEAQVLRPLRLRRSAAYQRLVWDTNTLSEPEPVPDVQHVIVEGISSYHPTIADHCDYKLWVDAPMAVAKARGRARDSANENAGNWDLWAENDLRYQDAYDPRSRADFIVDNG